MAQKKLKACLLLIKDIKFDNRVLRHAETFKKLGFETKVLSVKKNVNAVYEKPHLGIRTKFLPHSSLIWPGIWNFFKTPLKRMEKELARPLFTKPSMANKILSTLKNVLFKIVIALAKPSLTVFFKFFKLLQSNSSLSRLGQELVAEKADIYVANDLPALPFCYRAAKINKAKLVYDSHELFLEVLKTALHRRKKINDKIIQLAHSLVFKIKEKKLIKKTDLNITVNKFIARFLAKKYKIKKPLVIRSIFQYEKPKKSKIFHKKFALSKEKIIILYQGNISYSRGLETLIDSLKLLDKKFILVFMGEGILEKRLKQKVRNLNFADRVFFTPPVLKNKLISHTAAADIGAILTEETDVSKKFSLPNKLFEYMMAGLPIVSSDLPETRKIIKKENIGVLVKSPKDPKEITRAIKQIVKPKNWNKYHKNALASAKQKYNWETEEKKLIKEYKKICVE